MKEYSTGPARPFLKWAGGKTQILEDIWANLPNQFRHYYEPFLGGGAVFFLIWNNRRILRLIGKMRRRRYILSDKNEALMNAYDAVKNHMHALISDLEDLQRKVTKENYLRIRKKSKWRDDVERAATFIYLNKTCYNGLFRVNRYGKFNVPWGGREDATIYDEDIIRAANSALSDAELRIGDFKGVLRYAGKGDLAYTDPPYFTEGFCHYTSDGFVAEDHQRLAETSKKLNNRGCKILHSNSNDEFIERIYSSPAFIRLRVQSRRMINSDGSGRNPVYDFLIRNYSDDEIIGPAFEQTLLTQLLQETETP